MSTNDSLDRLTAVKRAYGVTGVESWTQYTYSPTQTTVQQDQAAAGDGAIKTETYYDNLGRPIQTRQYTGTTTYNAVDTAYNAMGAVQSVSNPYASGTTTSGTTGYTYDALGRTKKVTAPDTAETNYYYDGIKTTVADAASNKRASTTDAAGRMASVTEDPLGVPYTTNYTYNALDNLTLVSQGSQSRIFTYDSLGRLLTAKNPETNMVMTCYGLLSGSTCASGYDQNGNLLYRTDPRGVITSYAYDDLNRITSVNYYGASYSYAVAYTYDTGASYPIGRLTSVANSNATQSIRSYDALGRIKASRQTSGADYDFSYTWNLAGGMLSMTYPTGRIVTTGYDAANRPNSLTGNGTKQYVTNLTYAPHGALSSFTYNNGVARSQTFNNRLQTYRLTDTDTVHGTTLLDLQYGYPTPNNGNPTQIGVSSASPSFAVTQNFLYDKFNRLCAAAEGASPVTISNCTDAPSGVNWRQNYTYDAYYGNMSGTSTTNLPALPASGSYNSANNRLLNVSGVGYDSAGNQNLIGSATLNYDGENRIVYDVESPSNNTRDYKYDGLGQRISKTITASTASTSTYIYDAFGNLAVEYPGGPPPSCTTCYVSMDHLGSTRLVTGQDASVVARHDFAPFGTEIPASVGSRTSAWGTLDYLAAKFTGQNRDTETGPSPGLDYFLARHFAATQGRFMQPDPANAGADPGNPQSWNMYSYVGNNPLSFVDPDGLAPIKCTQPDDCPLPKDPSPGPVLSGGGIIYIPPGTCVAVILDKVPSGYICSYNGETISPPPPMPPPPPIPMRPGQGCAKQPLQIPLRITCQYGCISKSHPQPHTGRDYAAPVGTPVYAPFAGVVGFEGALGTAGNAVAIQSPSVNTYLFHLSLTSTSREQSVTAGDLVGYSGNTGHSTGPHLHFEQTRPGPINLDAATRRSTTLEPCR